MSANAYCTDAPVFVPAVCQQGEYWILVAANPNCVVKEIRPRLPLVERAGEGWDKQATRNRATRCGVAFVTVGGSPGTGAKGLRFRLRSSASAQLFHGGSGEFRFVVQVIGVTPNIVRMVWPSLAGRVVAHLK
jgi:hypothetical protein